MKHYLYTGGRLYASCARLSLIARLILFIGLPYIAAHLLAIALYLFEILDSAGARYHAYVVYAPQAESLLCSLTILIGAAALFDYLDKRGVNIAN